MKRKVSFRMFFTILGRGIWQAICWVAGMFGYNDKSTYGKVVRRIFAGSVAIVAFAFAVVVAYAAYTAMKEDIQEKAYRKSELTERQLSQNISYMQNYYTWHDSYLFNYVTGKKMHEGKIAWIIRSEDDDSLAGFSDGKKRGKPLSTAIYTGVASSASPLRGDMRKAFFSPTFLFLYFTLTL